MENPVTEYAEGIEKIFSPHKDKEQGQKMADYMKNNFPFIGIPAVPRRNLQKPWIDSLNKNLDPGLRWELIHLLWLNEEREYHQAAIDWMMSWKKDTYKAGDFKELERLITQKSWWDSVDTISGNIVGRYVLRFPEDGQQWIDIWRHSDNFWLQRTCLLFQLKYKQNTDFGLLKSLILQFMPNKEFFIQKAIGWTLREYAKTNPEAVRSFISEIDLQGLAKREASKYL